jgi:hypothetical protein
VFMLMKAGLIVAVFMHMLWERLAMVYAILLPPLLLLVLVWIGPAKPITRSSRATRSSARAGGDARPRRIRPRRRSNPRRAAAA